MAHIVMAYGIHPSSDLGYIGMAHIVMAYGIHPSSDLGLCMRVCVRACVRVFVHAHWRRCMPVLPSVAQRHALQEGRSSLYQHLRACVHVRACTCSLMNVVARLDSRVRW